MDRKRTVAVVEDDADIAEVLRYNLRRAGFDVEVYGRGDTALAALRRRPPDLVLLDLMLPGVDGLEIARLVRRDERAGRVPIIMLTARGEEADRIVGFEVGADDYIVKPFSPREVVLRVRAVLRRREEAGAPRDDRVVLEAGTLRLLRHEHRLLVGGEEVRLTATEFRLLEYLMLAPGIVRGRDALLTEVWGYASGVDSRTVDTHVRRLRRKLGPEAERIETVVGVGYRFHG
ncbi:MAG: response regulator transcription factor [Acidobacteriota bacterium]|nr:MAG: response regulator [Acidobacteriota bacterium]